MWFNNSTNKEKGSDGRILDLDGYDNTDRSVLCHIRKIKRTSRHNVALLKEYAVQVSYQKVFVLTQDEKLM